MIIAVTMRSVCDERTGERRDAISRDVLALCEREGFTPLLVPNAGVDAVELVRSVGAVGLVLTGGNDLCRSPRGASDPSAQGIERECSSDSARDATERALLTHAVVTRMPVFGICRGMQMLARHFGAPLAVAEPAANHVRTQHAIKVHIEALEGVLSQPEAEAVSRGALHTNSFHDWIVRTNSLPVWLRVFAHAGDGVAEGIRHADLPMLGVQWHPERAHSCSELDAMLLGAWRTWCMAAMRCGSCA